MMQVTTSSDILRVGIVSVSDRASQGVYADQGIPALQAWLARAVSTQLQTVTRLIQDDAAEISAALIELVDSERCHLVLTTGGTGPARRDATAPDRGAAPRRHARFWRTNATNQPAVCAYRDLVAPSGRVA